MVQIRERATDKVKEWVKEAGSQKALRKAQIRGNVNSAAKEIANSLEFRSKGRVIQFARQTRVSNVMSNQDRRRLGLPEDLALPDYAGEEGKK